MAEARANFDRRRGVGAIVNSWSAGGSAGFDMSNCSKYRDTQKREVCFTVRALCAVLTAVVVAASGPASVQAQAQKFTIAGSVFDADRRLVGNAKIIIKDVSGNIVAEAVTDAEGRYCLENLAGGQYELILQPLKTAFQGETVFAAVGPSDLSVDWMISPSAKAIAVGAPGTVSCQAFTLSPTAKTILGGSFASAWLGSLIAVLIGVSRNRRTTSPSQ